MSLEEDYKRAKDSMFRNRAIPVSHHQRLEIFGLFRQAEVGDCTTPKPSQDNIIAYQKWIEHSKHKGLSTEDAKNKYIDLVASILKINPRDASTAANPPTKPKMPAPYKASQGKKEPLKIGTKDRKSRREPEAQNQKLTVSTTSVDTLRSTESEEEKPPPLPVVKKPTQAEQDRYSRAQVFRSRHFSSVAGLNNPLVENEDIEKKYEVYEKIRSFYAKNDPERVKRGLGNIVEWTMTHGEAALNENLKKKYGKDLKDMEMAETKQVEQERVEDKKRRETQMILSRRFLQSKDTETRKKMDKLTRFLLVNDPELVSRGMFLMVKFIEAKGLGALNENLKRNYGKSLDGVSDEELNAELKAKYGNDLDMLNAPLFGNNPESPESRKSMLETTLQDQLLNLDPEKMRQTQLEQARAATPSSKSKQKQQPRQSKGKLVERPTVESFDERAYMETLSSKPKFMQEYKENKEVLRQFLEKYEPYRFEQAFKMISDFFKKNGLVELNKKLKNKYDVDLDSFHKINVDIDGGNMSDDEFDIRVLQFVTKHEAPKNIEKAVKAMTDYRKRQGIAALNTKLYVKYGETLNDVMDDGGQRTEKGLSMAEIHAIELDANLKEKLKSYYAKYDPMILGNGVERIFEWTETNGQKALDRQLKAKYQESLTEFIESEKRLKQELEAFYKKMDSRKLGGSHVQSVLAWAVINGRDALNFNLRKKYDQDLDSVLRNSTASVAKTLDV